MTCGIYKIKNMVNGKLYIGQSVDIERRWSNHKCDYQYDYKKNHLYSAFRKYGLDNFEFSIICEVPENVLDVYEISYIKYYDTTDRTKGYNKKTGGANGRHSEETKKKLSEAMKGKPSPNKGKTTSDATKKKLSEANKGRKHTAEAKKNISKSQKGKTAKHYIYQNQTFIGKQELANFVGISYKALESRIYRKQIDVTIIENN